MSGLRLTTLITAISVTVLILFATIVGEAVDRDLIPAGLVAILYCLGVVNWTVHIAAWGLDRVTATVARHIDQRLDELRDTIGDYGDERARQGLALGLRGPKPAGRISLVD
jgi:hypothetical protein